MIGKIEIIHVQKDALNLIKKLLDKIQIQCLYCKNTFNYENYIYKHFSECYKKNKLIKCPFCSNCDIPYYLLEEYENKHLKEKEKLLNEIEEYKKLIKELKNNGDNNKINQNNNEYKWSTIQKKTKYNNFTLSNNNKNIKIDYRSCYNMYFLDYNFNGDKEYSLGISVDTYGKELVHIYLGFINENFDLNSVISENDCLCDILDNCYYINIYTERIYEGHKEFQTKIENKTKINLLFMLDLKNKTLNIKNYDSNISYGKVNVTGNSFKFFVGKCNDGVIEYHIID